MGCLKEKNENNLEIEIEISQDGRLTSDEAREILSFFAKIREELMKDGFQHFDEIAKQISWKNINIQKQLDTFLNEISDILPANNSISTECKSMPAGTNNNDIDSQMISELLQLDYDIEMTKYVSPHSPHLTNSLFANKSTSSSITPPATLAPLMP